MVFDFQDPDPLARCMDPDLRYCYVLTFSPNPAPEKQDQKEVTECINKRYGTILTTFPHSDADPDPLARCMDPDLRYCYVLTF
jgi:hypothetical protein